MSQFRIAVIVGSLRKDSLNRKLANALVRLAPPELTFKQILQLQGKRRTWSGSTTSAATASSG